jgi:methylated-DNA-[protein]-cysteine S-methyltransferase
MIRFARIPTPIGALLATTTDGRSLSGLYFEGGRHAPTAAPDWIEDPGCAPLEECAAQVAGYLEGRRRDFDLPVAAAGTPFQQRVWKEIAAIPFGKTITYAQLAERAGSPGSARAAGAATGRNPHSIIVPCHRVIGTSGRLTGYAGGLERKAHLLRLEGIAS